ncbi:hypothetical protein [Aeoliella mucimassa]|uniref:Uncharacterized protein n=1 Tax=Aeoliella mucimassa TaxID=2527972 RepID=A0A518ATE4_9BACT|nr:hypothetical protein [Aeoliella mucimassa]QDU57991.1 hypothetical protein Pan181_42160 [Aeoliella mucimassa]
MGKLYNFILGVVVGFGLYHATFNYHLMYADDGLHLIAKQPPRFSDLYVDVRGYSLSDWAAHPELLLAVEKAGKRHLVGDAAEKTVNDAVNQAVDKLFPKPEE